MTWLLLGLSWLRSAFSTLLGAVTRWPWQCALVAAVALSWWQWSGKREALEERDMARAQIAQIIAASEEAGRLAIAARAATELRYRNLANAIDKEHSAALADARSDTDAFIARNRVSKAAGCPSGTTAASSQGGSASIPAEVPADPVLVGSADVQTCAAVTTYAVDAFKWANRLANPQNAGD